MAENNSVESDKINGESALSTSKPKSHASSNAPTTGAAGDIRNAVNSSNSVNDSDTDAVNNNNDTPRAQSPVVPSFSAEPPVSSSSPNAGETRFRFATGPAAPTGASSDTKMPIASNTNAPLERQMSTRSEPSALAARFMRRESMTVRRLSFDRNRPKLEDVDMTPEVPRGGCLIQVHFAGLCIMGDSSVSRPNAPASPGIRNCMIYEGYEISGVVEIMGTDAMEKSDIQPGDRVAVFPTPDFLNQGYADVIAVADIDQVMKLPDKISLECGAMLATTGVKALKAVETARPHIDRLNKDLGCCNVAVVGAGALCLWAIRLIKHQCADLPGVKVFVTDSCDKSLELALKHGADEVVKWSEELYEEQLVERLRNATSTCGRRGIDVAICLVESTRVMNRLLLAMPEDHGVLIVNSLNGAYKRVDNLPTATKAIRVEEVQCGTICDMHKLVGMLDAGDIEIKPSAYQVFPAQDAENVFMRCMKSQVEGKSILKFAPETY